MEINKIRRKSKPIVIAHRGASGYLPEHSLASKAAAHVMDADFIEQDVVLTKDGVPIVMHDVFLDYTTDVAKVFPDRKRSDGHYYTLDFYLHEIRQLFLNERVTAVTDTYNKPVYRTRFPDAGKLFRITTLREEIAMISGLNVSRGKIAGLYLELKSPRMHLDAGFDIAKIVLDELSRSPYGSKGSPVYLQCFDPATLKYLIFDLNADYPLIQLLGDNSWKEDTRIDYDVLRSPNGLKGISSYAAGIGPWIGHILLGHDSTGKPIFSKLVSTAKDLNLLVHPFTFRSDELPQGVDSFEELLQIFLKELEVDGIFTDFPDLAINFINKYL